MLAVLTAEVTFLAGTVGHDPHHARFDRNPNVLEPTANLLVEVATRLRVPGWAERGRADPPRCRPHGGSERATLGFAERRDKRRELVGIAGTKVFKQDLEVRSAPVPGHEPQTLDGALLLVAKPLAGKDRDVGQVTWSGWIGGFRQEEGVSVTVEARRAFAPARKDF